jgi:hypothetical protein
LISRRAGLWVLIGFTLAVAAAAVLAPRIPQSQSYHDFADHRALLGIPNFGDVASNLLFVECSRKDIQCSGSHERPG